MNKKIKDKNNKDNFLEKESNIEVIEENDEVKLIREIIKLKEQVQLPKGQVVITQPNFYRI